jgi:hypothetical protein
MFVFVGADLDLGANRKCMLCGITQLSVPNVSTIGPQLTIVEDMTTLKSFTFSSWKSNKSHKKQFILMSSRQMNNGL